MSTAEGAPQGAMHVQDDEDGAHAQVWRARTRDSVHDGDSDPLTLTERSQELIAARWGKPITEPPPGAPLEDGERRPVRLQDGLNHLHAYRDPLPSQRAVAADNAEGWKRVQEAGLIAAGVWGLAWLTARPVNIAATWLHLVSERPMRWAGFLFVAGLFYLAFKIAMP